MARFWLTTVRVEAWPADGDPTAAPLLAAGSRNLAIEVLSDRETSEYAVLFSTVDDVERPTVLRCQLAFTNAAKPCSVWRDRGVPLVDARIVFDEADGRLCVFSPFFGDESPMRYESMLFMLTGLSFDAADGADNPLATRYEQFLEAPDGAQPEALITRREVTWAPERRNARRGMPLGLACETPATRYPSLAPFKTGPLAPVAVWTGDATLPPGHPTDTRGPVVAPSRRADVFGMPAFRFEDVEVLGFRIDLADYGRDFTRELDALVRPLNFHLEGTPDAGAPLDFRYRAATRTLVIELLRYGRMLLKSPAPPVAAGDYQSQHELLVRLLVGRVDDDTAQARSPAVYVPAIFVDNPWSKLLGRDLQGFDKRLASFWVPQGTGHVPLLPDGRVPTKVEPVELALAGGPSGPRPLGDISHVTLVDKVGSPAGPPLLDLDCSPLKYDDWNAFERVDLGLALGSFALSGARWQQFDFEDPEFRRSFARAAARDGSRGFRSIQVSPVTDRGLDCTWITGLFAVDEDLQIARPSGVASLTLHAARADTAGGSTPSSSKYWNTLCEMLGDGRHARISFSTGNWYRLRCSMDLTIDDGLDWTAPTP